MSYLVETALITQGLASITQEQLFAALQPAGATLLWLEQGRVRQGTIEDFLPFRQQAAGALRINCHMVEQAIAEKQSGAFTASGTMAICEKEGIPYAVTCGMGGIDNKTTGEESPDLFAITHLPVTLIATSPKDMLNLPATLTWLRQQGITLLGREQAQCNGYLFCGEAVPLDGLYQAPAPGGKLLLLNGISPERQLKEFNVLEEAVQAGYNAVAEGLYFHPAVNDKLDHQSLGYSSQLQLEALVANIHWAQMLSS